LRRGRASDVDDVERVAFAEARFGDAMEEGEPRAVRGAIARTERMLSFAATLFMMIGSATAVTTEQTTTFKVYPPVIPDNICTFAFVTGCPWTGADGGTVSTVQLGCGFRFSDPLPAGSIVTQIDTRVSLLSSPNYSGITGYVNLNENGFAPVFDPPAIMGTFSPPTQQTGCPYLPFFSGGLTTFLSVGVSGVHNPAGLSKYNYRLTPAGTLKRRSIRHTQRELSGNRGRNRVFRHGVR